MYETWYQTRALIGEGRVDIRPIITHRLPLEDFQQAFEMMIRGEAAKVALFPDGIS
jgi:threonine 3-dehydrogenase